MQKKWQVDIKLQDIAFPTETWRARFSWKDSFQESLIPDSLFRTPSEVWISQSWVQLCHQEHLLMSGLQFENVFEPRATSVYNSRWMHASTIYCAGANIVFVSLNHNSPYSDMHFVRKCVKGGRDWYLHCLLLLYTSNCPPSHMFCRLWV